MMTPKCDINAKTGCVSEADGSPTCFRTVFFFRIVDAGETELTRPTRSTMEFEGKLWRSLIVLKWKECKGMEGNSLSQGWRVDVDERTISRW